MHFNDRADAGRQLAQRLLGRMARRPVVVIAMPRGGVPVAYEVAAALAAPLDVIVVRKLGAPHRPELGIGALAEGGAIYLDEELVTRLDVDGTYLQREVERARTEVERRV